MTIAYLNPSPDTPGHVCARDEHGQRLDTFSGPRPLMVLHYQRVGYDDVRDEHGRVMSEYGCSADTGRCLYFMSIDAVSADDAEREFRKEHWIPDDITVTVKVEA